MALLSKITKEVKVAILAITTITLLVVGLGYLKGRAVFGNRNFYYVHFDQVSGLPTGSKVQLSGTDVGVVQEIKLDPQTKRVRVGFDVDGELSLPKDTYVVLTTTDLFGSKALVLLPGSSTQMAEDKATLQDSIAPELMDKASAFLDPTSRKLNRVLDNLGDITEQLNGLMKQEDHRAKRSLQNVETLLANLAVLSGRLNASAQHLDALLVSGKDLAANPDLKGSLRNLHTGTDSLAATAHDLRTLANRTEVLMRELNTLTTQLNQGQGTAGKLLKDPVLYDNLSKSTASLNSLLEDLKANPKRYAHFSVFGRKDRKEK
jgi:phospholipid/cholesterol/gamma-HCH transport system substrate-binding protein